MALDETIREQAAAWAVRTSDAAFEDWEAFTVWLEQDSAHARAYDEVMASVIDATEALPVVPPAQNDTDAVPHVPRRRWFAGAAGVAAAVAAAFGAWQFVPTTYSVETAPGEVRLVELEGTGQVELAGGSRIVLDRDDPRVATLEQGQALFTIDHDPAAPFTVTVGEDTLVDIGTVFDVTHSAAGMALAVSEGAVVFNPERQNVTVSPGQRLTRPAGSDAYRVSAIGLGQVGEWREGRLTFQDARLADLAADLSRLTGVAVSASELSANQRVSGSLLLEPVRSDPRSLGGLLGVPVRHNGQSWEIGTR